MALRDEIIDALEELEADTPELGSTDPQQITFYLRGSTDELNVPCVPSVLTDADRLIDGGFESAARFAVNVRCGNFLTVDSTLVTVDSELFTVDNSTARPQAAKLCKFRGIQYRIFSAGEDPTRAFLHLVIGPDHV